MHFIKNIISVSLFAVAALAQGNLMFTSTPTGAVVGKSYTITWSGGNAGSPVTILLREGNPGSLKTISTITSTATGGTYSWTPDTTLPDGGDYALEIQQGSTNNYSGQFAITGGTAIAASSSQASIISSQISSQSSVAASLSASASSAMATATANATMSMSKSTKSMPTMTAASTPATSSSSSAGAIVATYQSPFALIFGAVAAIAYLQ